MCYVKMLNKVGIVIVKLNYVVVYMWSKMLKNLMWVVWV